MRIRRSTSENPFRMNETTPLRSKYPCSAQAHVAEKTVKHYAKLLKEAREAQRQRRLQKAAAAAAAARPTGTPASATEPPGESLLRKRAPGDLERYAVSTNMVCDGGAKPQVVY